ncbi:HNH endonuclease [Streptomyces sp. AC512_CC834]|uniref:HNH endonuclease n=1 Tax=Streptomyces sp. AC512_CC834 TaxID=2823691 RepID=UPI001C25CE0F|nr:HNH endonuclease signature motif containing protein [Streptomyces sp. AC512_CC834]
MKNATSVWSGGHMDSSLRAPADTGRTAGRLTATTEVTLASPRGDLRRRRVAELCNLWHQGVSDAAPVAKGGVTRHGATGKWQAQVRFRGEVRWLGLHEEREAAERAVAEFRAENPNHRQRLLMSVRRNHVRAYDERTLLAERAQILDIRRMDREPVLRVDTDGGRQLRCGAGSEILTPEGWRTLGELGAGDSVMVTGKIPRPSEATIPPSLRRGIGVWTSMQRNRLIRPVDDCYVCRMSFARAELELDHVVPVARDLLKALDERNLAPICEPCHAVKNAEEQQLARRAGMIAAARPVPVVAIAKDGVEETYEVAVQAPAANLLANGMVLRGAC